MSATFYINMQTDEIDGLLTFFSVFDLLIIG